jgi:hypothetical protein
VPIRAAKTSGFTIGLRNVGIRTGAMCYVYSGTVPACFRWTIGALFLVGQSVRNPADSAEFLAH